jgi:hypothetical protein
MTPEYLLIQALMHQRPWMFDEQGRSRIGAHRPYGAARPGRDPQARGRRRRRRKAGERA